MYDTEHGFVVSPIHDLHDARFGFPEPSCEVVEDCRSCFATEALCVGRPDVSDLLIGECAIGCAVNDHVVTVALASAP